jgi:hypothetical protein
MVGLAGQRAVVEEQADLPVRLEHLIRDPESAFEGRAAAVGLIPVKKDHGKLRGPGNRLTGGNELSANGYGGQDETGNER